MTGELEFADGRVDSGPGEVLAHAMRDEIAVMYDGLDRAGLAPSAMSEDERAELRELFAEQSARSTRRWGSSSGSDTDSYAALARG